MTSLRSGPPAAAAPPMQLAIRQAMTAPVSRRRECPLPIGTEGARRRGASRSGSQGSPPQASAITPSAFAAASPASALRKVGLFLLFVGAGSGFDPQSQYMQRLSRPEGSNPL